MDASSSCKETIRCVRMGMLFKFSTIPTIFRLVPRHTANKTPAPLPLICYPAENKGNQEADK